ncbi:hypothetical protein Btru_008947 [Bulinus truncatus]|nr:hypothetical protein Btru_008947 [Bulinus truncatus]
MRQMKIGELLRPLQIMSQMRRAVFDPKLNKVTKTTGLHNHPPDSNQMMRRQFINNVKNQILEHPHVSAKQMYDMEVQRVKQELTELGMSWKIPPYSCVKHHAYRARKNASLNEDGEVEEEEMLEEQPIKRQITETEKKFLEETVPTPQEEESSLNMSLLSPAPVPVPSRNFPDYNFYFIPSKKGKRILVVNDYTFRLNSLKSGDRYYWKCTVDPCLFRCVYNENINDLVKVSGKHNHATNIHKLRTREFCFLIKACMAEDTTLTPKKAYDSQIAKISALENGEQLIKCLPAYSSIRTSLYNLKHKRALEEEQGAISGLPGISASGVNNYYHTSSYLKENSESGLEARNNVESAQDISPKDITHLSLEDNDPMEHDDDDRGTVLSSTANNNPMDITAPSLYDSHDIIDQFCEPLLKGKISAKQEDNSLENFVITMPDPATYTLTFVPTSRGGHALVVNGCVLRISYTREFVTYWRCLNNDCNFRCSYDSQMKRISQENELSPKIIYDEELQRLKETERDEELNKKLPSYDSLKSTLYKVKNKSVRQNTSLDEALDYMTDESDEEKDDDSLHDSSEVSTFDYPPNDPIIEECYVTVNAQLPSWLEQEEDKRILDGHLLVKRSITDTSTGWACSKDTCPFRCVIDKQTNAITRNQSEHTHKSVIKQTIAQAMFSAVKKRAVMELNILPKTLYEQERNRLTDKLSGNKTLLKFIPSLTQVYQLVTKTRASPPTKSKLLKSKLAKESKRKKTGRASENNVSSNNTCINGSHLDSSDYLLDHSENDADRVSSLVDEQQSSLLYSQGATNILPSILESAFSPDYQSSFPSGTISFTNILPSSTSTFSDIDRGQQQIFTETNRTSQYSLDHVYNQQLSSAQQKHQAFVSVSSESQQSAAINIATSSQNILPANQSFTASAISLSPNSENIFTLHGYPLLPAMTQLGNIYWQCRVPGCQFQCVLNAGTSQVVQISGNHNHEPPGSHSAFCSQVVKMLQRKAAENLDEPLNNIYWDYMKDFRNVLDSDEILSGLPRFLDVALAMQSARSAMGAVEDNHQQFRNLVVGTASSPSKVFEYHLDVSNGCLVVNGDSLALNWKMNELSSWRCKKLECRFKCMQDDELQCVHVLSPHTPPCLSSPQADDRNTSIKRKYPDKPSPRRHKFQKIEDVKQKPSH